MIYHDFHGLKLSALGLGCMRFPTLGSYEQIDMEKLKEMVAFSMDQGINYFDTAWPYHGGNSETAMGEVLKAYPRDSFFLATKFPGFNMETFSKAEEIFEKQIEKCQVDYFDFYLLHNVCEANIDGFLNENFMEYILKQKRLGRIRHLGFSTHGSLETMMRLLDAYGEHIAFCQIQLNWLDWSLQNARVKVDMLNKRNIPVWVMEPVRGGKLCNLTPEHEAALKERHPDWTMPQWAFRFLQGVPGVTVVLSGMSDMEQLRQNVETFSHPLPLSQEDTDALLAIGKAMTGNGILHCTGCRYCTDYCPQGLNIPWLLELYNGYLYSGGERLPVGTINTLDDSKKPSACVGCKGCESVCPQNLPISKTMAVFAQKLSEA